MLKNQLAEATSDKNSYVKNTVLIIMAVSCAMFVVPSLAIILILDAFFIGTGSKVAMAVNLGAVGLCIASPILHAWARIAANNLLSAKLSKNEIEVLGARTSEMERELTEVKGQLMLVAESADFSRQLLSRKGNS